MIEILSLDIPDVKIIKPKKFADQRGFFSETYHERDFAQAGIPLRFVQDNHSMSSQAGTIRGLHFQAAPFAQDKLVRVVRGRVYDVAVDLRRSSRSFGKWVGIEISAADWKQVLIPKGFAHGFCTLEADTEVIYKVTDYYSPAHDLGVLWNDPDLAVDWPVREAILSDKDARQPRLRDITQLFD